MRTLIIAAVSAAALTLGSVAFAADTSADHSEMMQAQQKLQSQGLYKGKIDGVNGPATETALKTFQKRNNLQQSGRLDEQTEAKLGISEESGSSTPSANPGSNDSMSGSHSGMPPHSGTMSPSGKQ
ncbi:MAG TPA: peptidoglycan-binding protein [Stellaceae bacterium]|jgi:peptidoglycan hydrolase-like protein with peptidoglycan-binding domain|nr:peptidoglycan-binding protein [Stellaceae bacterium]